MPNPLRYRIIDVTGTCFDSFVNKPLSPLERKHNRTLVDAMNSVRSLDNRSAIYAAMCLTVAGFRENIDYELQKVRTLNDGHTDTDTSGNRG